MIISANRLSSINGKINIGINENYGSEDLGRILMEDAKNDMAIFNASVMQDMREIQARQEGTMLESEIQALSEGAIRDFCKKIVEKLKAFWAKMKSWFKTAIANISAYVVRDGNAFVKMHLRDISSLKIDDECGTRWALKTGKNISEIGNKIERKIDELGKNLTVTDATNDSSSDISDKILQAAISNYSGNGSFYDAAKEYYFDEVTNATVSNMGGTTRMIENLKGGKKSIESIKKMQKSMDSSIKNLIKTAENEANRNLKNYDNAETKDNDAIDAENKRIKYLSNLSTAATNSIATGCKTAIKLIKFDMAQCRKALATAIGRSSRAAAKAKYESVLLASMLREADEEIEQLSDNEYASDLTPEEEKAVEELVDAIEEKIEDSDDFSSDDDLGDDE